MRLFKPEETASTMSEYEREQMAIRKNRERLKAERLAREAKISENPSWNGRGALATTGDQARVGETGGCNDGREAGGAVHKSGRAVYPRGHPVQDTGALAVISKATEAKPLHKIRRRTLRRRRGGQVAGSDLLDVALRAGIGRRNAAFDNAEKQPVDVSRAVQLGGNRHSTRRKSVDVG
jgi:hypothetical protein